MRHLSGPLLSAALLALAPMAQAQSASSAAESAECDRLAGFLLLPRIEGAAGVYAVSDPAEAIAACSAARTDDPDDPFLPVLEARARLAADPENGRVVSLLESVTALLPALAASEMGRLYETGRGGLPTADRQARALYTEACEYWPDRTAARGCTRLAVMQIEGRGGAEDEEAGFALLDRLCLAGWGNACTEQAFQTDLRGMGDFDALAQQVATLFEAGCAAGDLLACSQFGYRLETGNGVNHDAPRAQGLYRLACEGGEPQGCSYLGEIYRSGLGVVPDILEAVRLFQLGCEGNDPYACVTLGDILSNGRGIERDLPRAVTALEHACWLGDPEGCDRADALR